MKKVYKTFKEAALVLVITLIDAKYTFFFFYVLLVVPFIGSLSLSLHYSSISLATVCGNCSSQNVAVNCCCNFYLTKLVNNIMQRLSIHHNYFAAIVLLYILIINMYVYSETSTLRIYFPQSATSTKRIIFFDGICNLSM